MPNLQVVKLSGAGNTFVIVNEADLEKSVAGLRRPEFAQRVCDITEGAGADGLVVLRQGSAGNFDYEWDFYNSDGSHAEMCGNAARCVVRYIHEILLDTRQSLRIKTAAGVVVGSKKENDQICIQMPRIEEKEKSITLTAGERAYEFIYVNTGVPHLVLEVDSLETAMQKDWSGFRFHPDLLPAGANVSLYQVQSPGICIGATYERGVEGFTQACGTGAVAIAVANRKQTQASACDVRMPGGTLNIDLSGEFPQMTGPAIVVGYFTPNGKLYEKL